MTRTGRVEDEPGSRKLHELLLADYEAKKHTGTAKELQAKLRSLKIRTDGTVPATRTAAESHADGFRIQQIQFESEPGIEIDATLYVPDSTGRKPAVLLVAGKLSDWLAERMAKSGRVVLKMEPRRSRTFASRPFVGDYLADERAMQVGLSLPALRAHDILRGVDLLANRDDVELTSIRAAAQGVKGIWLLLAAAADPRISKVWLDKSPYTLMESLHNTLNVELADAVIYDFLLHWDIDDLVSALGNRPLMRTDPVNWMGHVANAGPQFQYRYALGDLTDMAEDQDTAYMHAFLK